MNLSSRDKWMCAVLPALLTAIICQTAFTHPLQRENDALAGQIRAPGSLPMRQAELRQLESDHAQIVEAVAQKRKALSAAGAGFNRTVALQQISKLCEQNHLALVSSAPDASTKLPPPIAEAAKVLVTERDTDAPQIWRLELRGSYGDFLQFLNGLGAVPPLIVPLNLSMQPDPNEDHPISWSLTVWM
jgi:hypothetical protein